MESILRGGVYWDGDCPIGSILFPGMESSIECHQFQRVKSFSGDNMFQGIVYFRGRSLFRGPHCAAMTALIFFRIDPKTMPTLPNYAGKVQGKGTPREANQAKKISSAKIRCMHI